uniref:non-specific serine/threonine protein kinase n=1 Tax=Ditylenchus dipsaci TaxID=166011 RepID=A0A915E8V8_9BILA
MEYKWSPVKANSYLLSHKDLLTWLHFNNTGDNCKTPRILKTNYYRFVDAIDVFVEKMFECFQNQNQPCQFEIIVGDLGKENILDASKLNKTARNYGTNEVMESFCLKNSSDEALQQKYNNAEWVLRRRLYYNLEFPIAFDKSKMQDINVSSISSGGFLTLYGLVIAKRMGDGSFSTVHLVSEKKTSRRYAAKVCHKVKILREKKVTEIHREKEILRLLSPKKILIHSSFSYCAHFKTVNRSTSKRKQQPLSVDQCRFIAAELLSAMGVSHHRLKIVHRDLKPENMLIKDDGHIMVSDFGCAKRLDDKTSGTPQYVSPEVLNGVEVQQAYVSEYYIPNNFGEPNINTSVQKILKVQYSFGEDSLMMRLPKS